VSYYWDILHPVLVPRGNLQDVQAILGHGFGRNSWSDGRVGCQLVLSGTLTSASAHEIVGSLANNPECRVGIPNVMIADRVRFLSDQLAELTRPTVLFLQWEVAVALRTIEPKWYSKNSRRIFVWFPGPGTKLSTRSFLLAAQGFLAEKDLRTVANIGQPYHLPRIERLADKVFGPARVIWTDPFLVGYDSVADDRWFDSQSIQRWTRSPAVFRWYERTARIHHRIHGWT
jgi:hypothetical protein